METIISIVALIVSFLEYLKSRASNKISVEANKISEEANQLVKIGITYNKEKDKQKAIKEIINKNCRKLD